MIQYIVFSYLSYELFHVRSTRSLISLTIVQQSLQSAASLDLSPIRRESIGGYLCSLVY